MSFLTSLFVLWTFPFWGLFAAIILLGILLDVNDHEGKSLLSILLFIGAVIWFNPSLQLSVSRHPLTDVLLLLGYLFAGVVWMYVKWTLYCSRLAEYIRLNTPDEHYLPSAPKYKFQGRMVSIPLKVSAFKSRLIGWMMNWPVSVVSWVFGDLLRDVYDNIFRVCADSLQKITNRHTALMVPISRAPIEPKPNENTNGVESKG